MADDENADISRDGSVVGADPERGQHHPTKPLFVTRFS